MVCWNHNIWQVLKCIYLVLIQCSQLVEIYTCHGYFGWACIKEALQFQIQRQPIFNYKIILFEIQSGTCVVHVRPTWISRYILIFVFQFYNIFYFYWSYGWCNYLLLPMLGFPLSQKCYADFCYKPSRLFLFSLEAINNLYHNILP